MKRSWQTRALFASLLALAPAPLIAKPPDVIKNGAAPAAAPAPTAPPARREAVVPETLANLGDRKLMQELADRGLDSLLDRYFDIHQTPENEQKALRSMQALRDLGNAKLSNAEKEKKVKQIVEGIKTNLPNLKDPFRLSQDAGMLLIYGITRDANLLEYWGENTATQARLRPNAEAVFAMLGKASKEATTQAGQLAGKINAQNQNTVGAQWEALDNLSHTAEYRQNMMAYFVALSMPKAERGPVVDSAVKYLAELDNADSTVMPLVHLTLGKLNLVAGKYDDAVKFLDAVGSKDATIQPAPEALQQYDGKYFGNVARLEAGKIPEAKKGLDDLIAWEKSAMPTDPETQKGIAAAAEMLRYRIFLAEGALAKDPAAKKTAETNAVNVLLKLSQDRPDLRGIIYQQLVERLPKDAPVKDMDPLLLQGLMAKGYGEASKPEGSTLDQTILQRGYSAAVEVAGRKNAVGITPQMKDEAGRLAPVLLEAMGKKLEAAQGYLKYAQDNATIRPQFAQGTLQDAGRLAFELRKTSPDDPQVSALYDQFLPVAVNPPFSRIELAFAYAQRLRLASKPQEAINFYRVVPKSDRNYNSSQFYVMLATQDLLDNPKLPPAQRPILANDLIRQAEQVRQNYASASDPSGRKRGARATLIAAETANADLKKPEQALQLLDGFEATVKGTPNEKPLITAALLDRVNASMASGKLANATDTLKALLNQTGGAQGAEFVRELLGRLDKNFEKAEAAQDTAAMAEIARSEAELTGYLVGWARSNPNPEIKKSTYQYMVFDARTKRLAGSLAPDAAQRQKLLEEALASFKKLQDPENTALYKAGLDPARVKAGTLNPELPDPTVQLGIGLTDFELKNYKESASLLGDLLNNGKLGGATIAITDPTNGDQKVIDNDVYWDATYKLYQSNVEAGKGDETMLAGTRQGLKNLLIRGGIPSKWEDKFEGLRKEIIPDFNVATLLNPTSQPSPATQPVSAR